MLAALVLAVGLAFQGCSTVRPNKTGLASAPATSASPTPVEAANPTAAPAPTATPQPTAVPAVVSPTATIIPAVPTATPDPTATAVPKPAAVPATVDPDVLATLVTEGKERPDIMFLEQAREKVLFQILTPEYLPEGYEAEEYKGDQYVMVLEGFKQRKRGDAPVRMVRGVMLTYHDRNIPADSFGLPIHIEQTLGGKGETTVGPAEKEPNPESTEGVGIRGVLNG